VRRASRTVPVHRAAPPLRADELAAAGAPIATRHHGTAGRDVAGRDAALTRRAFMSRAAAGLAATLTAARSLDAQQVQSNLSGPMRAEAYVAVRRPPKPGATPRVTDAERDSLEGRLKCGCTCPLDVYTCRTTDFACPVSPRMHADVETLIAGGYDRAEIIAAFVETWGERVLTAPKPEGFNLVAYVTPFLALGVGGAVAALLIRRWLRPASSGSTAPSPRIPQVAATPDELARLDAAMRDDS
jgi:cytochrome c-type biogenesis protein CcmH